MHTFAHLVESDLRVIWSSRQISRANGELHRLNDEMNRFMGIAAHDMRNALNVFMGCSRYLLPKGDNLSRKERIYLDLIDKSGTRSSSSWTSSWTSPGSRPCTCPSTSTPSISWISSLKTSGTTGTSPGQKHTDSRQGPAKPVMVRADPAKIEQVLNNLISNALKYSPAGSTIQVSIDAAPTGPW
jgi:signal transduction histidine kinase